MVLHYKGSTDSVTGCDVIVVNYTIYILLQNIPAAISEFSEGVRQLVLFVKSRYSIYIYS